MGLSKITPKELDALAEELQDVLESWAESEARAFLEMLKGDIDGRLSAWKMLASKDAGSAILAMKYAALSFDEATDAQQHLESTFTLLFDTAGRYAISALIAAML